MSILSYLTSKRWPLFWCRNSSSCWVPKKTVKKKRNEKHLFFFTHGCCLNQNNAYAAAVPFNHVGWSFVDRPQHTRIFVRAAVFLDFCLSEEVNSSGTQEPWVPPMYLRGVKTELSWNNLHSMPEALTTCSKTMVDGDIKTTLYVNCVCDLPFRHANSPFVLDTVAS